MKETIYYYKDYRGDFHFSNGQIKNEQKAGQYLRMLRYAKYPVEQLFLDNPDDFKKVRELFNIPPDKTWKDLYFLTTG